MKMTINRPVEIDVRYLQIDAGVRYWEDGEVNGEADDGTSPKMPGASGGRWKVTIELETGRILDWPEATTASIHYKVCDAGVYSLLDADKRPL